MAKVVSTHRCGAAPDLVYEDRTGFPFKFISLCR